MGWKRNHPLALGRLGLGFQFRDNFVIVLLSVLTVCVITPGCDSRSSHKYSEKLQKAIDDNTVKILLLRHTWNGSTPAHDFSSKEDNDFHIYCYDGPTRPSLRYIWTSPHFRVSSKSDNGTIPRYYLYIGRNESDVYEQHLQVTQSWLNLLPWQPNSVRLDPFNKTCIGVDSNIGYLVHFKLISIDYLLVLRLFLGLVLFFSAGKLAKNVLFYYSTGISIGLVASLLIVVFLLSRFMPKKIGASVILLGGWSLALYALQYVWENSQILLEQYKIYVLGYLIGVSMISFAVLYYKGPITNQRAVNLIQWTLQLIGLGLVYSGTQIHIVSVTLICGLLLFYNLPIFLVAKFQTYWQRKFPPKIKLLTEEEYLLQGQLETSKALEELRLYCRSPDCDAWRTLSRVRTPSKFAQFVEGESHVSEEEMEQFENDPNPRLPSDEEEAMDTTF